MSILSSTFVIQSFVFLIRITFYFVLQIISDKKVVRENNAIRVLLQFAHFLRRSMAPCFKCLVAERLKLRLPDFAQVLGLDH